VPTTQLTRAAKAKLAKVLYPDTDEHPESLFWLGVFFRETAEIDALQALAKEKHRLKRSPHTAVFLALYGAIDSAKKELKAPLGYVIEQGQLLFAHQDTTIFNKAVQAWPTTS